MYRLFTVIAGLLLAAQASADCPDYLDQSMRKLHSKQDINFCELQAGKPMLLTANTRSSLCRCLSARHYDTSSTECSSSTVIRTPRYNDCSRETRKQRNKHERFLPRRRVERNG